jgi:hypothetical protein
MNKGFSLIHSKKIIVKGEKMKKIIVAVCLIVILLSSCINYQSQKVENNNEYDVLSY